MIQPWPQSKARGYGHAGDAWAHMLLSYVLAWCRVLT